MYQNDFIKRAIEQVANLLASITQHTREGEIDEARAEIDVAYGKLLRIDRRSFEAVDSHTAAGLIGPADAIRSVAKLCQLEADLDEDAGNAVRAAGRRRRALELWLEAHKQEPKDEDQAAIDALAQVVPQQRLAARYR